MKPPAAFKQVRPVPQQRFLFLCAAVFILSAFECSWGGPEVERLSSDRVRNPEYTLKVVVDGKEISEKLLLHEGKNLITRSYFNNQGHEITVIHEVFYEKPSAGAYIFTAFIEKLKISYTAFMVEAEKAMARGASSGQTIQKAAQVFFKAIMSECQAIMNLVYKRGSGHAEPVGLAEKPSAAAGRFFKVAADESSVTSQTVSAGRGSNAMNRVKVFFELILKKTNLTVNSFGQSPGFSGAEEARAVTFKGPGQAEFIRVIETPVANEKPVFSSDEKPTAFLEKKDAEKDPVRAKKRLTSYESKSSDWKKSAEEEANLLKSEEESKFTGVSTRVIFPDDFGGMTVIVENQRKGERVIIHKDQLGRELRRRTEPLEGAVFKDASAPAAASSAAPSPSAEEKPRDTDYD